MSTSLYWRPTAKGRYLNGTNATLKEALRAEFGGSPMRLSEQDVPFLRGLRAAKVEGADELIELIERHGSIEVWEES